MEIEELLHAALHDIRMELRLHLYLGESRVGWRLWPEGWENAEDWSYRPEAGDDIKSQLVAIMFEAREARQLTSS